MVVSDGAAVDGVGFALGGVEGSERESGGIRAIIRLCHRLEARRPPILAASTYRGESGSNDVLPVPA